MQTNGKAKNSHERDLSIPPPYPSIFFFLFLTVLTTFPEQTDKTASRSSALWGIATSLCITPKHYPSQASKIRDLMPVRDLGFRSSKGWLSVFAARSGFPHLVCYWAVLYSIVQLLDELWFWMTSGKESLDFYRYTVGR